MLAKLVAARPSGWVLAAGAVGSAVAAGWLFRKLHGPFTAEKHCRPIPGTQVLQLPDGRQVGYIDGGCMTGPVVVFWHGTPGCRLSYRSTLEPLCVALGLRLITIDRPGVGLSSPLPRPATTAMENVADVGPLLRHLGVKKFAVAGQSGGGPHVLGTMQRYGAPPSNGVAPAPAPAPASPSVGEEMSAGAEPVCVAGFITGGPGDGRDPAARPEMWVNRTAKRVARAAPPVYRFIHSILSPWTSNPAILSRLILAGMSPHDKRRIFGSDDAFGSMCGLVAEGTRQGTFAMAHEFFMIAVMPFPWGVKASDIAHLPLWWWNGSDDRNLDPYGAVRAQQKHLRGMKRLEVKLFDGYGHQGPVLKHGREMLALLKAELVGEEDA